MPQLDIYTYFTQFQWFLLIFTLLFLFINNQFIPSFQSLFIIRGFLRSPIEEKKDKFGFDLAPCAEIKSVKKNFISSQSYISEWEKVYAATANESSINKSNKLNENIINPGKKSR